MKIISHIKVGVFTSVLSLAIVLAGCQSAPSVLGAEAIHEAVKQGDVSTVREAAESGNAEAQFFLGLMYEKGAGVEKNYKQADAWYRKAARQGHALAQNNLGSMYYYGKGVEKDYLQAFGWYQMAARQGIPEAQTNLMYIINN